VESATGSFRSPELAAALHRLRSTLARLKAELELAEAEGSAAMPGRLLGDLNESLMLLQAVEQAAFGVAPVLVVDDDARLAELTARGLRRLGYDADSTSTLRDLRRREAGRGEHGVGPGLHAASERPGELQAWHSHGEVHLVGDGDVLTRERFRYAIRLALRSGAGGQVLVDLSRLCFLSAGCAGVQGPISL